MNSLYAGILFSALGLVYAVLPDLMIRFRVWTSRKFMKMEFTPTRNTRITYRIVGLIVLILGLINLYNYYTS